MKRDAKGKLLPGSGCRPAGSRNKLQADFVQALAEDFEEHGTGVIRIVRAERPAEYLKIVASILPKELLIPDNVLEGMDDDELADAIETIRRMKGETNKAMTLDTGMSLADLVKPPVKH